MRQLLILSIVTFWLAAAVSAADNGMVSVKSAHPVGETVDRLETALKAKGMTIFARIDHAAGARQAGHELRPTELVIFGNPKVGAPLMICAQKAGIDLPLKALVWEDADGTAWLTYNDPAYLKGRHAIEGCDPVLGKMAAALANFAAAATAP